MLGLLQIVGNGIIASAHFYPKESKLCFIVGMGIIGFSRGAYSTPFILVSYYFSPETEQKYLNIWYGLSALGKVFGYFFTYFLLTEFIWSYSLMVMSLLYLTSLILQHIYVP